MDKVGNAINKQFNIEVFKDIYNKVIEGILKYGIKGIIGIIILLIGFKLIKHTNKIILNIIRKSALDVSLEKFIVSTINLCLKFFLVVFVMEFVGIESTSLITMIGAAGIAVGFALQGSLANFAGGILILFLKPFSAGDYVSENATGHEGVVEAIDIFYTTLRTRDNRVVVIPNGNLSNNSIMNYTKNNTRRIDITVSAGYNDDIRKVKDVLMSIARKNEKLLSDPEPVVVVSELGESSIHYLLLVWVKTEDYLQVKAELLESVKYEFDVNKISIPYPQLDLHVKKGEVFLGNE